MKTTKLIFLAMALLYACATQAQTNFTYNSPTLNTVIPDGNPVGVSAPAVTVSGVVGPIYDVQVQLNISGGFNGDLYATLAGPDGQFAVLLNRVGMTAGNSFGYGDTGFDITLDSSGSNIHDYQSGSYTLNGSGQLTGTWAPDGRNIPPDSSPSAFDSASTAADLASMNGSIPVGQWTLFLADLSGGGQSTLVSWGLTIVTVPEPQTWAMLAGGAGMLMVFRRRYLR